MIRNSNGIVVNERGEEVFKSDIFKKLSGPDHLVKICPSTKYLDVQIDKAYLPNPEDARNFVEYYSSKLVDDNTSLASNNEIHNSYVDDVVCFLGMVNGINKKAPQDKKNIIMGGTFPTKNDNSEDSKVPLYLITEMLKAKCQKDLEKPVSNLDNYDLSENSQVVKDSTLGNEFDKVINIEKQLDYDKELFSGDMSKESMDYFERCSYTLNVDTAKNNPPIDNYAKVEDDKCDLYVEQGDIKNKVTMFNIVKKQEVTQDIDIPTIEKPVVAVQTDTNEITNNNVDANSKIDEEKQLLIELEAALDKVNDIKARLHSINESRFKKTPQEIEEEKQRQINEMIGDNAVQQEPVISQNALMFK